MQRQTASGPATVSTSQAAPPRTLRFLLILFAWTTLLFWLPTVRSAFDGPTYEWNLFGFGGKGLAGDYWFVLLGSAVALALQVLGWLRGRTVAQWLLLCWFGLLAAGAVYLAVTAPDSFRFRGDTLGIDVSLAWVAPLLFGAATALAGALLITERRRARPAVSWSRRNSVWLAALAGLLPLQFVLLRFGEPDGITDQVGVLVTIVQWLLVGRALRPETRYIAQNFGGRAE